MVTLLDISVLAILVSLVAGLIVQCIARRRGRRRLRAKDLAEAPSRSIWYLPPGWTGSAPPPPSPPALSAPPPPATIARQLRTRGYVVLDVEKWRSGQDALDASAPGLPPYTPWAGPDGTVRLEVGEPVVVPAEGEPTPLPRTSSPVEMDAAAPLTPLPGPTVPLPAALPGPRAGFHDQGPPSPAVLVPLDIPDDEVPPSAARTTLAQVGSGADSVPMPAARIVPALSA
ncbi:hypothetical protein AMAG_17835 [Allomyces macrogynus ATCC 38327]|uniref:Uncharacterized protein n=1 Tax=Allomyces macrogynus (strain ATCC 38327) TaxID=578462 RepID=A0A0L0RZM4_ALLM3|nr:hypothetical protein AMAG_17835 [Allomyces macrogynus ATCC 38327]|eukprot:KNE55872.1 hypothetical protein AMAG_17835 [Allomyces macrogynus ATCC 38327]